MPTSSTSPPPPALADDELRGQTPKAPSDLAEAIDQTVRLWRKHHLTYDQTKYLVEQTRRRLELSPPRERKRTVERLDWSEVQALNDAAYGLRSSYGLMVKTLFYTGARVAEFIHIRVDDLHLQDNPPQVHVAEPKRQSTRYVPVPPSLAHELRTHLGPRRVGFLFESNRHTRTRRVRSRASSSRRRWRPGSPSEFTASVAALDRHIAVAIGRGAAGPSPEVPRAPPDWHHPDLRRDQPACPW